jgi:iron complex transport system permease protein
VLVGVVLASLAAGLAAGSVPLTLSEVWSGLRHADAPGAVVVRNLRAPRVLLAFLVGGSLGVSGAALQALIRNPLAEPFLLGLSSGAGLGAVAALALNVGGSWGVPVAAFVGALAVAVYRPASWRAAASTRGCSCWPVWWSDPLPAPS